MTLLGDGLRGLAGVIDGTAREVQSIVMGPIWGAVSTPSRVELTPDANGPRVISYEQIYRTQPHVAAVVNKLVRQTARLPWRVYEGDPDGTHDLITDRNDPLIRLLNRPAPRRGALHLKQALMMSTLVHGNSVIAKYRAEGPGTLPTEMLKLDWPWLSAYARRGGPVDYWGTTQTGDGEYAIAASEVVHVAWEPPCGWLGVSPLEQLGVTIALDEAARRYQSASFRNGVRPSGALTLPKDAKTTPEERGEMRRDIEKMHAGVDQAFRLALLTGGAEFQPMSFNAQEAALIESRTLYREEVCMVYDVDPPLIGDYTHGTYSNVGEANNALYRIVLPPWLALVEEILQAQLIDPEPEWDGRFVRFDLEAVLQGDPAAEAQANAELVREGIRTRDEARRRLGDQALGGKANELTYNANNQQAVNTLETAANGNGSSA